MRPARAATLLLLAAACVPGSPRPAQRAASDPARVQRAVLAAIDPAADPCEDFYQYACGGWLAAVPPPEDRPQIMRSLTSIDARNRAWLVSVLERETPAPWHRKASAFFDSCMDVARIATAGLAPLTPWREEIDAIEDLRGAFVAAARMRRVPGASPFFALALDRDPIDPARHVLLLAPRGFLLPDAGLYVDEARRGLVDDYRRHVAQMLELTGVRSARARSQARSVVELERALARASLGLVPEASGASGGPPPEAVRGRAALQAVDPQLPWEVYFAALGAPDLEALELARPDLLAAAGAALRRASPETLRAYLHWHLLHAVAQRLGRAFEEQDFAFESKLTGAIARPPRPERCAQATLAALPDLVSRAFVAATFPGDSRAVATEMLDGIRAAFLTSLPHIDWMSAASQAIARDKARSLRDKVGHP
jgi:predicted metalloendopeptidase